MSEISDGTIEYHWRRPTSKLSLYLGYYTTSIISILLLSLACLAAVFLAALSLGEVESFISLIRIAVGGLTIVLSFSAVFSPGRHHPEIRNRRNHLSSCC